MQFLYVDRGSGYNISILVGNKWYSASHQLNLQFQDDFFLDKKCLENHGQASGFLKFAYNSL